MFGCCDQAMAIVYKDCDGNVDPEYIKAKYPEGSKIMSIQDSTSQWAKNTFIMRGEFPVTNMVVDPSGNKHEICSCPCHQLGVSIMC